VPETGAEEKTLHRPGTAWVIGMTQQWRVYRSVRIAATLFLVAVAAALVVITFAFDESGAAADYLSGGAGAVAVLAAASFVVELVDSSLGMGSGTVLVPVLLLLGLDALEVIPAILFSEMFSGLWAGGLHHGLGNVNLGRHTRDHKIMLMLAGCGAVGSVVAVTVAVNLTERSVETYIAIMVLAVGFLVVVGGRLSRRFGWAQVLGIGALGAFNKGLSGGGYGPIVTGGQILVGVPGRSAVGISCFAEGLVSLAGLVVYVPLNGWPEWHLAAPLVVGALLAAPIAAWTVRLMPDVAVRRSIGVAMAFVGALMLVRMCV